MPSEHVTLWSAAQTVAAVKAKRVSTVEVVQSYLERIDRLDPKLHAFITVCRQEALTAARQADQAIGRGDPLGPLFGVPIAVKDQFWTKDILTTNGSRAYKDFVPAEDATVIARIKQAGAILLGKLNLSELAMGGTQQPPWGIPRNPWDLERTPGESSSGSGVAMAANLCAASLGEDTGGSGRTPGAYCNVVGLRPTFTRVSRHRMTPMCWFLDAAAPMTKTVEDAALVLGAIAGYDPKDPYTSRKPVPDYTAHLNDGVKGVRIGLIRELYGHDDIHPEVKQAIEKALDVFREQGAHVTDVSIPLISLAGPMFVGIADTEGAGARDEILRTRPMELDAASRTRLQSAALVPSKVYNRALKARALLRRQFLEAFQQVDVLVSATSPFPPPKHTSLTASFESTEEVRSRFFLRRSYTGSFALAALPAISVPCGFTSGRLPIGMQLGASPFAEDSLLRVAHTYEQATSWHTMHAPEP